ncbi:hypothetical protein DYB28_015571 [Aphanomyces astaci]|uniref:Uncharacterized protein n=1 Tax=Aphanomyces astaci TaxID=112090 RepID=A0A9X8DQL5_APHAT|nr:hypothetical protein DYB28_015571 [Aphanomyces astaci]
MEATNEERPGLRPTDPGGATSSADLLHRRMDALERQMDSLPDRICLAISRQAMAREAVVDETLYLIRQRLEGIETRVDRLSFGVSRVLDGKPHGADASDAHIDDSAIAHKERLESSIIPQRRSKLNACA